jgi:hypothetical protein
MLPTTIKEKTMGAVKDLFYDIESLFIEGYGAKAIAVQLGIPVEEVNDVLDTFGVDPADVDAESWDELEADEFDQGDYFGA